MKVPRVVLPILIVGCLLSAAHQAKGDTGTAAPAVGCSAGKIAFTTDRDGNDEIYVMNPDGTGLANLTNNPAKDRMPCWSPDAAKIAFVSDRDGNEEIYVMNADGSGVTRLTNSPGSDESPSWSTDGGEICFASDRNGNREIFVMNADGSDQANLTETACSDFEPAWSPGPPVGFSDNYVYICRNHPLLMYGQPGKCLIGGEPLQKMTLSEAKKIEEEYTARMSKTYAPPTEEEIAATKAAGTRRATIATNKGDIVVELYGAEAPLTVTNFVKLANAGFYNGLSFHRVVPGFVIQGGDPQGTGAGGPGYTIKLEIAPELKHVEGALAMARSSSPDSAGSQFYITLADTANTRYLDGQYAVFGKVVEAMDVVKSIVMGDKIHSITVQ